MQEVSADNAPVYKVKLPWHRTVVGKVAIFMLLGVVFARPHFFVSLYYRFLGFICKQLGIHNFPE